VAVALSAVVVVTLSDRPVSAREPVWEPPAPVDVTGVVVSPVPPLARPAYNLDEVAVADALSVVWPAGGTVVVSLPQPDVGAAGRSGAAAPPGLVAAGDLPVRVGAAPPAGAAAALAAAGVVDAVSAPARLAVSVADRAATVSAGYSGLLVGVARVDGVPASAEVTVEVDYSGFRYAFGGQWASRLRVVRLGGCDDHGGGCGPAAPLAAVNDLTGGTLTTTVPVAADGGFTMLSVSGGPSGDNGTYTATDLSPAGTWQVSAQTGGFTWSYPLRVVPGVGGPQPGLSLGYSSQAVDGQTVNTNSQGSWIGDGWDLWPGFVERRYQGCAGDTDPVGGQDPNNAGNQTGDLCWVSDNATMSFNGRATELVRDGSGRWRGVSDDGARIEQLFDTSLGNGTYNGEYWKVTTTDGTQYFFGRHRRQGFPADTVSTSSTWTVPVYGNHPGEPCYESGDFPGSWCTQAWRWNLDYVVDPHGNTMTYSYGRETGAYGRELDPGLRTTYHRGGFLQRIEYGTRAGSEHTQVVPARVVFDVADRCLAGETCAQSNPQAWPDTPWDQYCQAAPCTEQLSPTFWTQKRLSQIRAQVWRGGGFESVESWTLRHEYVDAGASDGEGVPMWLAGITRTGHVTIAGGGQVSDPEIVFDPGPAPMSNRVNSLADGKSSLKRFRIDKVFTESGGLIDVVYSAPQCTSTSLPTPHTNTKRCFPQWYAPGGQAEELDWFHKYVVTSVLVNDLTGASPRMETHYEYLDDPAWAYTDSQLVPEDKRTWAAWRGYSRVRVLQGSPNETQSAVEYLFMRGMHGDRATPEGGSRSVQVVDSQGAAVNDHKAHAGFLREQIVLDGPGGQWVSGSINTPWRHGPTATSGPLEAYLSGVQTVRSRVRLESGGVRWTRRDTGFDTTYGMPTQVDDLGDEAVTGDEICTRYEYARNTATGMVDKVSRTQVTGGDCSQSPQVPTDVLSQTRVFFDDPDVYGVAPTRGLPVKVQVVGSWQGTTPVWVTTARTSYDVHGRVIEAFDALSRRVATSFTPATGGPVTATTTVDPMGFTATKVMEPAWGATMRLSDPNGRVSGFAYDGLGRLTAAWLPGQDADIDTPNLEFEYLLRDDAPSAVTSRRLLPDGGYHTTIGLFDGMLRPRQTQTRATGGGRVINDTFYDSRGLTQWASKPFYDTSNAPPSTTLVGPGDVPTIPGVVEYVYDGVGRVVDEIFVANGSEAWRSSYAYGGDRTHVTPPAGGTATTTITDARGQTVALRQYHAPTPTGAYDETSYGYTLRGEFASVSDPAGNTWAWEYDQRGRQTAAHDPDAGTTTTTYDAAGQVLTTTDARGVTLGYTYDGLGRRTSVREGPVSGPVRARWVYDTLPGGVGMLAESVRHHDGAQYVNRVLGYDQAGRPTGTRVIIPAEEGPLTGSYDTMLTYKQDGSVATMALPAAGDLPAEELVFLYDDVGHQTAYTSPLQIYVYQAIYGKLGELVQRKLGNPGKWVTVTNIYDEPTGRLVNTAAVPELKTEVLDLTYTYDPAGNLTRVADAPGVTNPNDTQCLRYDHQRRLTDAWTATSPLPFNCNAAPHLTSIGGVAPYRLAYTYDVVGNRTAEHRYGAGTGGGAWQQTTTYTHPTPGTPQPHTVVEAQVADPGGTRLQTYTYDPAGQLTDRTKAADIQTLSWTAEGQIESIDDSADGLSRYVYDADGNRLLRRDPDATTLYLGGQELRHDHTTGTLSCTRYYTHQGTQIAVRTAGGLTWLLTDHHNTATVAIDAATLAAQRKRTLPFGGPRGTPPAWWAGDKGFLGGTEDPTGLTHLGARLYDPTLGRFISLDPVMDLTDPQQMHGYAYANNNPTTWSDPTGTIHSGGWCVDGDCSIGHTTNTIPKFTWQDNWACVDYCGSEVDNWLRKQGGASTHPSDKSVSIREGTPPPQYGPDSFEQSLGLCPDGCKPLPPSDYQFFRPPAPGEDRDPRYGNFDPEAAHHYCTRFALPGAYVQCRAELGDPLYAGELNEPGPATVALCSNFNVALAAPAGGVSVCIAIDKDGVGWIVFAEPGISPGAIGANVTIDLRGINRTIGDLDGSCAFGASGNVGIGPTLSVGGDMAIDGSVGFKVGAGVGGNFSTVGPVSGRVGAVCSRSTYWHRW
jgi:RHS repeat-associated protein